MKINIQTLLLICSLVFNITLVSFLAIRSCSQEEEVRRPEHNRIERRKQHPRYQAIREQRSEYIQLKRDFFNRLSQADINEEKLNDMVEKLSKAQEKIEHNIGTNLIELRKSMTDEEAKQFFEKIAARRQYRSNKRRE